MKARYKWPASFRCKELSHTYLVCLIDHFTEDTNNKLGFKHSRMEFYEELAHFMEVFVDSNIESWEEQVELMSEEEIRGRTKTHLAEEEWITNLNQILKIWEIFAKMGEEPPVEELVE